MQGNKHAKFVGIERVRNGREPSETAAEFSFKSETDFESVHRGMSVSGVPAVQKFPGLIGSSYRGAREIVVRECRTRFSFPDDFQNTFSVISSKNSENRNFEIN